MSRRTQQRTRFPGFEKPAMTEHRDTVGKLRSGRYVVADEQKRHRILRHQPPDQRNDLGLNDRIERAGRFVGNQQAGPRCDCRRDRNPLFLPAG